MASERFKHIISLGQFCQTAYQINRYLEINYTNFFDYKRTSIECLIDLFNNDFHDVLLPGNLSITPDRQYIRDEKYNLMMFHDFRNEQGIITDNFMDLYPTVKSKFDHLIDKFRKVLDSHDACLFIYTRNRFKCQKHGDIEAALELEKALKNRAPGLIPKILYIDTFSNLKPGEFGNFSEALAYSYKLEETDSFYQKSRKHVELERWKGSDLAWNHIFDSYLRSPGKFDLLERNYNNLVNNIRYYEVLALRKIK